MKTRPMTEPRLRIIVAGGQWSTSWLIAVALLAVILHISVPDWLTFTVGLVALITAPTFLVLGMFLTLRLPDWRRWVGLAVNVFLILCGVALMHWVLESDRANGQQAQLAAVHQSASYITAKANFDAANAALQAVSARTFDQEYKTAFQDNEAAKAKAQETFDTASAALKLAEGTKTIQTVSAALAFDFLGSDNATWVQSVVLFFFAFGNEMVAVVLVWRRRDDAVVAPVAAVTQAPDPLPDPKPAEEKIAPTEKQWADMALYMEMAKAHRQPNGTLGGYRTVQAALNARTDVDDHWSDYRARKTYGLCVAHDMIVGQNESRDESDE